MKSKAKFLSKLFGLLLGAGASAACAYENQYDLNVNRVIDGDTVVADVSLGFDMMLRSQKIRVLGVDTPELKSKDTAERKRAYEAKSYTIEFMDRPGVYLVSDGRRDAFGRILGDIRDSTGEALSKSLIANGLGEVYRD